MKSLRPLTPNSHIHNDGGEGVLDTNLTGEREPDGDRDCGEGDFVMDLDLDPEPGGGSVLGLDFDEAGPGRFGCFGFDLTVIEAGPGGFFSLASDAVATSSESVFWSLSSGSVSTDD